MTVLRLLRRLWSLLTAVSWRCEACHTINETSDLLWDTMKYALICTACGYQQHYPQWIRPIDPRPPQCP